MSDKAFEFAKEITVAVISNSTGKAGDLCLTSNSICGFFETVYNKLKELEQQKPARTQEPISTKMAGT